MLNWQGVIGYLREQRLFFLLYILSYHSGLFLWLTLTITPREDFLYSKALKFILLLSNGKERFFFSQISNKNEMMDILSIVADFVLGGIFLTVIFVYYTRGKSYFAHMHLSIAVKNINIRTVRGSNCFQKSGNVIQIRISKILHSSYMFFSLWKKKSSQQHFKWHQDHLKCYL